MPFDVTKLDSQTIIFGGLTLGILGMIWLLRYAIKGFKDSLDKISKNHSESDKLFFNHAHDTIDKNTAAWVENTRTNQKLIDVIENKLVKVIEIKK